MTILHKYFYFRSLNLHNSSSIKYININLYNLNTLLGISNEHMTLEVDILNITIIYFFNDDLLISIDNSRYRCLLNSKSFPFIMLNFPFEFNM